MSDFRHHVGLAIEALGSEQKLADAIGISQPSVNHLHRRAKSIRAELALAIERATNGKVSRHDLRPDIFGPAPEVAA